MTFEWKHIFKLKNEASHEIFESGSHELYKSDQKVEKGWCTLQVHMNEHIFKTETFRIAQRSTAVRALIQLLVEKSLRIASILATLVLASEMLPHKLTHFKVSFMEGHSEWGLTEEV